MTVVNPKSISGINSITTGSGSDDILTIHNNNGTERLRIDSTGTTKITTGIVTTLTATTGIVTTLTTNTLTANSTAKVGSGVTLSPDGDIFATGICTATSFSGDGSNLTGISAGTTLSGSTDNTVCTVTGANAIQGESGLTYNGTRLDVTTGDLQVIGGEGGDAEIRIVADQGDDGSDYWRFQSAASNNKLKLASYASGSWVDKVNVDTSGNLEVVGGNLVIGTSGKGIDFSATSDAGGMTSELLDDYEEGTFSPGFSGDSGGGSYGYSKQTGTYTKIGNTVHFQLYLKTNAVNANATGNTLITGLPFTSSSGDGGYTAVSIGFYGSWNGITPSQALVDTSNTRIYLYKNNSTSSITYSYPGDIITNSAIIIAGHYFAA